MTEGRSPFDDESPFDDDAAETHSSLAKRFCRSAMCCAALRPPAAGPCASMARKQLASMHRSESFYS